MPRLGAQSGRPEPVAQDIQAPSHAVIVDPQLRDRETKRYSWLVYVTTARHMNKCPRAVLLVICPDPAEARKCRRIIRTGHPGFDLAPIVIDLSGSPGGRGAAKLAPIATG